MRRKHRWYYDTYICLFPFVGRLTVSKIDCNFFPARFFSLSLIHTRSHRFFAARQSLLSSAIVYCFIRWITFLAVFKKLQSLYASVFRGSFKTISQTFSLSLSLSLADLDVTQLCGTTILRSRKRNFPATSFHEGESWRLTFCLKLL